MNSFRDSVVVITGASSGIGRELALQLARQGAHLVLAARNREALDAVAKDCGSIGVDTRVVKADVGERNDCERMIRTAMDAFGRIDMLINNAGISMRVRFDEITDPSLFEQLIRINYLGAVWCTMYALPHLKKTKGRIVAVSSIAGKTGVPMRTAYSASKHAMAGFFESLRLELIPEGVSVTTIYPGFVTTDIRLRALGADGKPVGADAQNDVADMSAAECARITLDAAAKRKREVVMTAKAKLGVWLKLLAPGIVDRMTLKTVHSRTR
jgi:NAD(P)-dependent dehydrogenase (short-subunit alcohol dehydrogenase family)